MERYLEIPKLLELVERPAAIDDAASYMGIVQQQLNEVGVHYKRALSGGQGFWTAPVDRTMSGGGSSRQGQRKLPATFGSYCQAMQQKQGSGVVPGQCCQ